MPVTCLASLALLLASIAAYRLAAAISPSDEVPRILLAATATICLACFFFSIPAILKIGGTATLLAIVCHISPETYGF